MPRVYIPLLPLPVLAVVAAFSACGSRPSEATSRIIPEAVALVPAPAVVPPAPVAPVAPVAPAAPAADDAPSDEEVRAFERPVAK